MISCETRSFILLWFEQFVLFIEIKCEIWRFLSFCQDISENGFVFDSQRDRDYVKFAKIDRQTWFFSIAVIYIHEKVSFYGAETQYLGVAIGDLFFEALIDIKQYVYLFYILQLLLKRFSVSHNQKLLRCIAISLTIIRRNIFLIQLRRVWLRRTDKWRRIQIIRCNYIKKYLQDISIWSVASTI